MSSLKLYGLKNCDTCKKALKALEASGQPVEFIDIRDGADLAAKVPEWLAAVDRDILVNRRSTTWRSLDPESQNAAMTDDASLVLTTNPTLIKRPIIETSDAIYVGWNKDTEAALNK